MAVKTGWSNTVLGNAVVVLGTGAIFVTLYALGAPLYTAAVMVAGAGLILLDQYLDQKHHQEFTTFADLHGWNYTGRSREYTERFATYPFGVGVNRRQTGVLEGLYRDHDSISFTHHWTDNPEPGKKPATHAFQVTLVEIDANLPRLDLISPDVGNYVEKLVGGAKVDIDHDDFAGRWQARAHDRDYALAVLEPGMVERLMEPDAEGISVRLEGRAVMMWQEGPRSPEELESRLDLLIAIADTVPAEVRAAHDVTSQPAGTAEAVTEDLLDDSWQQQWLTNEQEDPS